MIAADPMGKSDMKTRATILLIGLICLVVVACAQANMDIGDHEQQLIEAAAQNDLAAIQGLLKQGTNINAQDTQGRTALLATVEGNHLEGAKVLIAAGADVNVQDDKMDSPLLLAGAEGTLEILKLILQANPDFSLYNRYGGTPLIPACERGHVEVVKTLLQTDVDIDHVNNLGWTALLETVILSDGGARHQKIVQLLVDAGADVNIGDFLGITPLKHARLKGFTAIVKTLESVHIE